MVKADESSASLSPPYLQLCDLCLHLPADDAGLHKLPLDLLLVRLNGLKLGLEQRRAY
jgi:hypothetical protein